MESSSYSAPSRFLQIATLAFFPLLAFVVGGVFLPTQKSLTKAREGVDRSSLKDVLLSTPPKVTSPLNIVLAKKIAVLGAELPMAPVGRGGAINIKSFFKAVGPIDRDWKMFMHIDRNEGNFRIHGDHFPASGRYPTSLWRIGDQIVDAFSPRVPIDAPSGKYTVFVGFYIDKERLRVTEGDKEFHDDKNRIRLGEVVVK